MPPSLSVLVSALLLIFAAGVILFVVRGCVATQHATGIRKYVATSDSILTESRRLGSGRLQRALKDATAGRLSSRDREDLREAAARSRELYERTLLSQDVPRRFVRAHHYLQSALGMRARETERLASAASEGKARLRRVLSNSVAGYRMSDAVISDYYMPAVKDVLREEGQINEDAAIIYRPEPFVDYGALGFGGGGGSSHGVAISGVRVGGRPLYAGGTVVLKGADRPVFAVEVANEGRAAETGVPVEVVLEGETGRQIHTARIRRIPPGGSVTVTIDGFRPGLVNETDDVRVEAGPVRGERYTENNTLAGKLTFGI